MDITVVEEAEFVKAKTSIWWDIENCAVPNGCDAHGIAQKLSSALMKKNYYGPLTISSYGNTNLIPNSIQLALSSTGIDLNHVPSGKKNASDKKILVDMLLWVVENPPPANIMLISGDGDFSDALHRLRMRRYNILLAHPQQATAPSLLSSAKTTWLWGSTLLPPVGCPPTHCISEESLSKQTMGSESNTSRTAGNKVEVIYVPKASNQLMQQDSRLTETSESVWFCKVCNVACKTFEISTMHLFGKDHAAQCKLKQNFKLLGESKNMVAIPSECHEKDVEMTNKMVEAGVATSSCNVCPSQMDFDAAMVKAEALVDVGNIEESVHNDLQSREEQNKELVETCATFESSGRELRQVFIERLEIEGGAPLNIDCVFSELSRDSRLPKELRECFESILKRLEPSINEILIEKLDEGMPKQGLEMMSGEPENLPATPTEHLEEDINKKKKKRKRKKKQSGVTEDNTEAYVCSICSVIFDHPTVFEHHLKGRKHAKMIKKHAEALLEEIIQDNNVHPKERTEEIRSQEYSDCLEKQKKELEEDENKPLPNEECIFTDLNSRFLAPQEAREGVDAIIKKLELSQDASSTWELESIAERNLKMDSCDPQKNSAGATEHPEEYMEKKKTKHKVTDVCSICSVICYNPITFESHLKGRKHAARLKKHEEVLFDDKKILEESLQGEDHPIDALQELLFQSDEVQENIKEVCQITKEELENESEIQLGNAECFFTKPNLELPEPNEAREQLDSIIKIIEDTTKQSSCGDETAEEKRKKNGDAVRVCNWCNVMCSTQVDFDSHLAGKKHAAGVKKQSCDQIYLC